MSFGNRRNAPVVACMCHSIDSGFSGWQRVLAEQRGLTERLTGPMLADVKNASRSVFTHPAKWCRMINVNALGYEKLRGKLQAARALATQVRHFQNWPAVWSAYRCGGVLPNFQLRNGLVLHHVNADDPIFLFTEVFLQNCYFSPSFYTPVPAHTVLDIGANIGFFALYLQSLAPGIHVHCFEPGADARSRLDLNVKGNRLDAMISVYPIAVFDAETTVELKEAAHSAHRSLFASQFVEKERSTKVNAVPLQKAIEMAGGSRIDLLKIDVEGAEIEIAEGADPHCWQNIERVVVEYHDLLRPGCKKRVSCLLSDRGYRGIQAFETSPGLGLLQAQREPFAANQP
jgi:FkbM family methyltransferase